MPNRAFPIKHEFIVDRSELAPPNSHLVGGLQSKPGIKMVPALVSPRRKMVVYTMIAERGNETVKSERNSLLITVAKARVWVSEGWQVTITNSEGKVFEPAEFESLLAA
jgi:hypothetical protein